MGDAGALPLDLLALKQNQPIAKYMSNPSKSIVTRPSLSEKLVAWVLIAAASLLHQRRIRPRLGGFSGSVKKRKEAGNR